MAEEQPTTVPAGDRSVQLGIGTLIIIALIVTMCSGKGDTEKIQKDTAALKQQVGEINRKLDELVAKEAAASAARDAAAAPADAAATR